MRKCLGFLLASLLFIPAFGQLVVSGTIYDQNEHPISNVKIDELGTANTAYSDADGSFTLSFLSSENVVQFTHTEFNTLNLSLTEQSNQNIFLQPITGGNSYNLAYPAGYLDLENKLPNKQLENMPYFLGEADVNRQLQMLPGVEHGTEGFSNLYIRGGDDDQNLMLYNGTPVYNFNHIFGLSSIFHHKSIDNSAVYRGIAPSKFGGRTSSVINLESHKDAEYSGASGEFEMTPLNMGFYFQQINKNKGYFTISARRSWIDLLLPAEVRENDLNPNFFDLQLNFGFKLKNEDKIDVSLMGTRDNYMLASILDDSSTTDPSLFRITRRWYNILGSVKYTKNFNKRLNASNSLHFSNYNSILRLSEEIFSNTTGANPYSEIEQKRGVYDIMANSDWNYHYNNSNNINFGLQAVSRLFLPSQESDLAINFPGTPDIDEVRGSIAYTPSFELSLYGDNRYKRDDNTEIIYGLRSTLYSYEGYFKPVIEPRIQFNKYLENRDVFKAGYSRHNQFLDQLNITGAGIADLVWVPATKNIAPQTSDIIEAGYEKRLGTEYSFISNAYFKRYTNLSTVSNVGDIDAGGDWESAVIKGTGSAYGLELLVQKNKGVFSGWLSYTIGRSTRNFPDLFEDDFLFTQDRTHMVKLYLGLTTLDDWNYGINYLIGSGSLSTLPIGKFYDLDGNLQLEYNSLNNYRSPLYQRVDISVTRVKDLGYVEQQWKFYLYNALGNRNPLNISADFEDASFTSLEVNRTYLAFVPGIAYLLKF